jgi:hypothetical protein
MKLRDKAFAGRFALVTLVAGLLPAISFADDDKKRALDGIKAHADYERNIGNENTADRIELMRERLKSPNVSAGQAQEALQDLNQDANQAIRDN